MLRPPRLTKRFASRTCDLLTSEIERCTLEVYKSANGTCSLAYIRLPLEKAKFMDGQVQDKNINFITPIFDLTRSNA